MKNDKFCGSDINPHKGKLNAKHKEWFADTYLGGLTREDIALTDDFFSDKKEFFLHAAFTEYDAENFCRHLETLDLEFSPEFLAFEKVWREVNPKH